MTPCTRVEVYSSYTYAVEPRAFYEDQIEHRIVETLRAWKTPGCVHFYVRAQDDRFFELIYEEANDCWFLQSFGETCRVANSSPTRPSQ
jgi:hypothetical protein